MKIKNALIKRVGIPNSISEAMDFVIDSGEPDLMVTHTYETYVEGLMTGFAIGAVVTGLVALGIHFIKSKKQEGK